MKIKTAIVASVLLLLSFGVFNSCFGDVLYFHDYEIKDYVIGEKEADVVVGYTDNAKYMDKETRYTGGWMKRIFGEVKKERFTSQYLLNLETIREIDWYKGKVNVFPMADLSDTGWISDYEKKTEEVNALLKKRYKVLDPILDIKLMPGEEMINKIPCRRVEARLRLETVDNIKQATSVTLVAQTIWVSDRVPGYGEYKKFHETLAQKMGLDAERLGNFNFLLQYWNGPLDSIRDSLAKAKGYPVKNVFSVDAVYTTGTDGDSPKTIKKRIKDESVVLREAKPGQFDLGRFKEPEDFMVEVAKP